MTKTSYKTISANSKTVNKEWVLVDAAELPLGRTASIVATLLRGKHKTNFTLQKKKIFRHYFELKNYTEGHQELLLTLIIQFLKLTTYQ